jgi:hypothetical protein
MRSKSRIVWTTFLVMGVTVLAFGCWLYLKKRAYAHDQEHARSVAHECLGQTRAQVIARFGPPTDSWEGNYHPFNPRATGPIETITYVRKFGTAPGTLYILFEMRGDQSVCIAADWLPEGREW